MALCIIDVSRIFDSVKLKFQITCNDVIRNFRKRNILLGKDIIEWKIKSRDLVWHLTKILLKEEGLNQNLNSKNV